MNTDKAKSIHIIILILFCTLSAPDMQAQSGDTNMESFLGAEELYNRASEAQKGERWERAIELYSRGSALYPQDDRFPRALGSLYYNRQLYGLAWEEYRKVETLIPDDPDVLYRLSRTAGYLNRDAVSSHYLERLLQIDPDNREAIGSLGWMYYKLHRLEEGEELLRGAVDRMGPDPDFSMTLGTIYSDMFRYDDAKTWYLDAISRGEDIGDRVFTAVAHYNLSILESRFYHYAEAFDRTGASLASQNRASGRLARGELFLRRLNISRALGEFQSAYELDTSPLSKVNLAQAYQIAGRLEEARLYAEDCLKSGDLSWMLNFGIDPDRYKRDIHEILAKIYRGLGNTEGRRVYGSLLDQIRGFFRRWYYWYKSKAHQTLYKKYSLLAGYAYRVDALEEAGLDAQLQYYNAFESYPRRALRYLRNARNFEVPLIPQSEASYIAEEGGLLKDKAMLQDIIPRFDPLWERDMIAEAYTNILRGPVSGAEKRDAAERLYALNRGALRQQGIPLPVELALELSPDQGPRVERALLRTIKKIGLDVTAPGEELVGTSPGDAGTSGTSETEPPLSRRFRLSIVVKNGEARCELYDGGRGTFIFRETFPLASLSRRDLSGFAQALGDRIFVVGRE